MCVDRNNTKIKNKKKTGKIFCLRNNMQWHAYRNYTTKGHWGQKIKLFEGKKCRIEDPMQCFKSFFLTASVFWNCMAHKLSFPRTLTHSIDRVDLLWWWIMLYRHEFCWWNSCGFLSWTGHYLMNEDFACERSAKHYIHLELLKDNNSALSLLCGYPSLQLKVSLCVLVCCYFREEGPSSHLSLLLPPCAGGLSVTACTRGLGGQLMSCQPGL